MPEPKEIGPQVRFSKTLFGLFQRGWWEIPGIMGSSALALVGIGLAVVGMYNYTKTDGGNPEYKKTYIIVRPGDPRECRLKNPVYTQFKCE